MQPVSLPAHFDGKQIFLDTPYPLQPGEKLLITVLSQKNEEQDAWRHLSAQRLTEAYRETKEEYSLDSQNIE